MFDLFNRGYLEFECTPSNESCVQLRSNTDYMPAMKAQAKRMLELLRKRFPDIDPDDFRICRCDHDFGTYLEIRFYYDESEEGYSDMNFVESHWPVTWGDDAPVRNLF